MGSNGFKHLQTCSKFVQMRSNVFKLVQNLFKCVQTCSKLAQMRSNVFKWVQNLFKCVKCVPACPKLVKMCSKLFKNYQSFQCKGSDMTSRAWSSLYLLCEVDRRPLWFICHWTKKSLLYVQTSHIRSRKMLLYTNMFSFLSKFISHKPPTVAGILRFSTSWRAKADFAPQARNKSSGSRLLVDWMGQLSFTFFCMIYQCTLSPLSNRMVL